MPFCSGDKGCKKGKPHQLSSKEVLSKLPRKTVMKVAKGRLNKVVSPCGGSVVLGRRAIAYAKQISTSAKSAITLDTLRKAFDEIFTSQMKVNGPTYLLDNGKLLAFVSTDPTNGKIVSREFFDPLDASATARVMAFIKDHLPDAKLQDISESQSLAPEESTKPPSQ